MTSDEMKVKLDALQEQIKQTFPMHQWLSVELYAGRLTVIFHECGDYEQASDVLRQCGIQTRNKQIYNATGSPWTEVSGKIGATLLQARGDGLPPSCKLEKFTERILKTQTVDTGEFVEVERTKVVCGQ